MQPIDQLALNFNPSALMALNAIIAVIIFGVALDLRPDDFRRLLHTPRAFLLGFLSQFLFLPFATLILVFILQPAPSIALGMFLVAACPGGNMSNFLTHHARGNLALSVSLTGVSTLCAAVATPLNFAFWSQFYQPAAELIRATDVSMRELLVTVFLLLVLPIALGMLVNARAPRIAERLRTPMRVVSLVVFAIFLLAAFLANWTNFVTYIGAVIVIVFLHNGVAFLGGYVIAAAGRLSEADRRAISIETGIQNSGLGLLIIFAFFQGMGGMALVAAWWGIWHLLAGFALATWFRHRPLGGPAPA